ncbi:MAG: ATP-binding protein [Thiogranum sp.]|nr:ATP-binding protein [Thiogranum sp.]
MADVVLHIDEETTADEREGLRDAFLQTGGIMAADYRNDKPHLMIIEYDPDTIDSSALLKVAENRGLHAELVGM